MNTKKSFNWPRMVFIMVPLLILTVDSVVLVAEHLQSDSEKAIRLVRESNSRKENFTVQQYLYMTVHHRRANGEPITIKGWAATPGGGDAGNRIDVQFEYSDLSGEYLAIWEADLQRGSVRPKNNQALDLSWR